MGEIVFWTLVRTAITIPGLWIIKSEIDFNLWLLICLAAIYVIIFHPALVSYRWFEEKNKNVISSGCYFIQIKHNSKTLTKPYLVK